MLSYIFSCPPVACKLLLKSRGLTQIRFDLARMQDPFMDAIVSPIRKPMTSGASRSVRELTKLLLMLTLDPLFHQRLQ